MAKKLSEVKRSSKIKEEQIEQKDPRWHTRNRIQLVFGSNDIEELETYVYDENKNIQFKTIDFHQAKSKAIEELLDNCIDEFYRGHVTEVHVDLSKDGKTITVQDNGIGFDVNKIKIVFSELRSGSKFKDESVDSKGFLNRTLGQNGVGASATCFTSDKFKVTVRHHNKKLEKTVEFIDGAKKIKETKPKKYRGVSGVKIEATLSPEVYKDNVIDRELLRKRIIDLSFNNPGLKFILNGEVIVSKKGFAEMSSLVNSSTGQLIGEGSFVHELKNKSNKTVKGRYDISFSLAYDLKSYDKEQFISFVNSTPTFDGGYHHDKAKRFFINAIKAKLERTLKKDKISLIDADITNGVCFILGIIMPNPRFESQTKRKLVRDYQLEKSLEELINSNIQKFFRKNPDYLNAVIERAKSRSRLDLLKKADKNVKKSAPQKIEKLLDANEKKNREKCILFICEGDSAIGGLRSSRNKLYQGGIALKGKPMNVTKSSLNDIVKNQEFSDIMGAIGLSIGKKVDECDLRFYEIVFLADSDVDGGHINTLLVNFFYTYWPDLFEKEMIRVAKAPLFEVITSSGKTLFAESNNELEKIKADKRVIIKEIHRNKGLGEMSQEAWDYITSKDKYTIIDPTNPQDSKYMLEVCFGKDSQLRKDLLLSKKEREIKRRSASNVTKKKVSKKKVTKKRVRK